jgi:hypothetical protein
MIVARKPKAITGFILPLRAVREGSGRAPIKLYPTPSTVPGVIRKDECCEDGTDVGIAPVSGLEMVPMWVFGVGVGILGSAGRVFYA